jgi:penicillin-binding protein 2
MSRRDETVVVDDGAARRLGRRAVVLGIGQVALLGALGVRLYDLQVLRGAEQAAVGADNRSRTLWIPAARGRILTASGAPLATSRESYRAVLYPTRGLDAAALRALLTDLTAVLRLGPADVERLAAEVVGRRRARGPVVLADGLTFEDVAALKVRSLDTSNVVVEPVWHRTYAPFAPSAAIAMAHIVGQVGAVERIRLDDDQHVRAPYVRVGKWGVEAGAEARLRGALGRTVHEIDALGRHVRRLDERAPVPGRDVTLTLDVGLQTAVATRLAEVEAGAAVVLDIATGGIRALVSTPGFDAGDLHGPDAPAAWRRLKRDPARPLFNRATAGQYPPGSTFKIVTALAALEAAHADTTERIACTGEVTYAKHSYRCWNRGGHGDSDLHKALRESCDCYFYEVARRTGMDRIAAMASELGLGQTYDIGLAPEAAGLVPTPAWKRTRTRTGWLLGETILAGIGQGYVTATPLQLAVMTARLACGRKVVPTIVAPPADEPPVFAPLAVSEGALAAVRRALVAVVNEPGGTGQTAAPLDGRIVVAGKTGTSQVSRASGDRGRRDELARTLRDHALFVAYAPADTPTHAVAVLVEHGGGGGTVAGPVVRDIVGLLGR